MPTSKRADLSKVLPAVRCTARKQNGEPCRAMAARGATVCRVHGGSAPQVKAAAKRRLDQAADALVQRLLAFALDGGTSDNVALQAIIAALDRAGLNVKQAMELSAKDPEPWEELMLSVVRTSRADWLRRRGLPPDKPLTPAAPALEVVDAEVVPESDRHTYRPSAAVDAAECPDPTGVPDAESATSPVPIPPPPRSLNQEEAAAVMRESRLRNGPVRRRRRGRCPR